MTTHPCQCEHRSHFWEPGFDKDIPLSPKGNPNHIYGALSNEGAIVPVKTKCGTFNVCLDCATDCMENVRVRISIIPLITCHGCGEKASVLFRGKIQPRFMPGNILEAELCAGCWEVIDHADPVTGAYGAACCDVRRASAPMGVLA